MQPTQSGRDRSWPRKLTVSRDHLHLLMEELGNIPRDQFIGSIAYHGGMWQGKPASSVVAKLKDQELVAIKLKFDIKIEKLKKSPKFLFGTESYYCE